jgi:hypothetical protein
MDILELLPEINEIRDPDLKSKVKLIWGEAMEAGDWTPEEIGAIPFTLLADDVNVTFVEHVRTVAKLCMATEAILVEAYGDRVSGRINRDHLVAGALLADVGKLLEFKKKPAGGIEFSEMHQYLRHPWTAVGYCWKYGLPVGVMHVIATHSWEGDKFKRRPESIIFHHMDFTDFELVKHK